MSVQIPYFLVCISHFRGPQKSCHIRSFLFKVSPLTLIPISREKLGSIWSKKYHHFLGWCGRLIRTNHVGYYEKYMTWGSKPKSEYQPPLAFRNLNLPLWGGKTSVGLFYHRNPNYSLQSYPPAGISASSCLNKRQVYNALLHPDV